MINLPIFRAKKIDKKETGYLIQNELDDRILTPELEDEYVIGFLYQDIIGYEPSNGFNHDKYYEKVEKETWYIMNNMSNTDMIDITTLSINFPDMLDSEGNKIFASLSEDGKGGDIVEFNTDLNPYYGCEKDENKEIEQSIVKYSNECINFKYCFGYEGREISLSQTKVIGIQK